MSSYHRAPQGLPSMIPTSLARPARHIRPRLTICLSRLARWARCSTLSGSRRAMSPPGDRRRRPLRHERAPGCRPGGPPTCRPCGRAIAAADSRAWLRSHSTQLAIQVPSSLNELCGPMSSAGLRGNKSAEFKRRLTNGLVKRGG